MMPVPREALVELLQAAGSPLTPEEFLASVSGGSEFKLYASRVKASNWSKVVLLIAVILSVVWTVFAPDVEGVLSIILLAGITAIEYRVNQFFRALNPEAPVLGFRNQSALAGLLLFYGLYHAVLPVQIPDYMEGMIDPSTIGVLQMGTRVGYLIVGVVCGVTQFSLAWYYLTARVKAAG